MIEIVAPVEDKHVMTLDALIAQMPQYRWNQVLQAAGALARG